MIKFDPVVVEMHEKYGWRLYTLLFCYTYTFFSIFLASYLWVLSNVFGFRIVGCVAGWCP